MSETRINIRIAKNGIFVSNDLSSALAELQVSEDEAIRLLEEHRKMCKVIFNNNEIQLNKVKEIEEYGIELGVKGSTLIKHNEKGTDIEIRVFVHSEEVVSIGKRMMEELGKDAKREDSEYIATYMICEGKPKVRRIVYDARRYSNGVINVTCEGLMSARETQHVSKAEYSSFSVIQKVFKDKIFLTEREFKY